MLCGILSDTINMTASTTTDADRYIATLLTFLARVEDVNLLAKQQVQHPLRCTAVGWYPVELVTSIAGSPYLTRLLISH